MTPTGRGTARDRGSVLVLVLVLMVIGSFTVLPVLDYAITVGKQNTVLSNKLKRQEAVKAGLRVALADPVGLYNHCAETGGNLAAPEIDGVALRNRCEFLDFALAENEEDLHLGLVATRVGEAVPEGLAAIVQKDATGQPVIVDGKPVRLVFAPTTDDPGEWLDPAAAHAPSADSTPRRIWLPNLPSHALNLRSPDGYRMPDGYPACTVYFPGTYADPLTIDGPAYFTSGVYYFQQPITFTAGADAVIGAGAAVGCSTDQEAAFYAENAPATHNISGLGATFVLGDDAKVVITNAAGAVSVQFNQRYVNETDTGNLPSFGVSIMSVNGKLAGEPDPTGKSVITDLVVDGVNEVPASLVGLANGETPPVQAGEQRYVPSTLTHEPRPPTAPLNVVATPLRTGNGTSDGAARIEFQPPENTGGLAIDQYVVTAHPGGTTCIPTTSPLECIITGLTHNQLYTFTVTATNALGTSPPSEPSGAIRPRTKDGSLSPLVSAPEAPAAPSVRRYGDDTVEISWSAPEPHNSPITSYAIDSTPARPDGADCVFTSATSCVIRGLPVHTPADPPTDPATAVDYVFRVNATNELGTSAWSADSGLDSTTRVITAATGDPPPDPEPVEPAPVPPYEPEPILDIDLGSGSASTVVIPGYVSVPMGVVRLFNPHGFGADRNGPHVAVSGGIIAAAFRVEDARLDPGATTLTVPIGLINPEVQRTYRIITETASGTPKIASTAVVQVNQNGAYAVNSWEIR